MFDHYAKIVSKAKYEAKYGKGLIILTPKEMLQRLPIACAQVKAGITSENITSENLLNKIIQIIYFFVSSKRNH